MKNISILFQIFGPSDYIYIEKYYNNGIIIIIRGVVYYVKQ